MPDPIHGRLAYIIPSLLGLVPANLSLIAYSVFLDGDVADSDQTLLVLAHIYLITIIVKVMELGCNGSYSLFTPSTIDSHIWLIIATAQ